MGDDVQERALAGNTVVNRKSIWAVAAGVIVIVVVTTLVDIVFHAVGVYPPWDQQRK